MRPSQCFKRFGFTSVGFPRACATAKASFLVTTWKHELHLLHSLWYGSGSFLSAVRTGSSCGL
eukprot:263116-Amphidinium_carterae.1